MNKFPEGSERMHFSTLNRTQLEKLVPIYNSNPFFNLISTGKSEMTVEEIETDWEDGSSAIKNWNFSRIDS